MRLNVLTYAYREKITNNRRYHTNWLWCADIALHVVLGLKLMKKDPSGGGNDVASDQGRSSKPKYLRRVQVVASANASTVFLPLISLIRRNSPTPVLTAAWSECPETPNSSKVRSYPKEKRQHHERRQSRSGGARALRVVCIQKGCVS